MSQRRFRSTDSARADVARLAAGRTSATCRRLYRLHGLTLSFIVLLSGGCSLLRTPISQRVADRPADRDEQVTLYYAGEILAGTRIEHAFRFQNRTDGALWLAGHDEIRPSCGCASARVADHRLMPGQTTEVWVQVQTDGRRGPLSEVVSVVWTTEDGRQLEHAFAIRGRVQSALVLVPDELIFDRQEVERKVGKHVECTSDLPVDWSTATVCAQAEYLEIGRRRVSSDGRRMEFDVSCRPTGTGDSRQSTIRMQVCGRSVDGTSPPQRFSFLLPVYAADPAPLVIAPRTATLQAGVGGQPWSGQVIVTGDAVADGADVHQIRCAAGRIAYQSTRIAAAALRVDLNWWPTEWPAVHGNQQIEVELTSGETRRATVRLAHIPHERSLP